MKPSSCFILVLCFLGVFQACQPTPPPEPIPIPIPTGSQQISLIFDEFQGLPIVIAGSPGRNLIVSFQRRLADGSEPQFSPSSLPLPVIMQDQEGNAWDLFGEAVSGPMKGERLLPLNSYMGYWFAFGAFFPGAEIYGQTDLPPHINPEPPSDNWLLPLSHVFAGTAKDAIPSIDSPQYEEFRPREYLDTPYYLQEQDLIIGIKIHDHYLAYPHAILNWHEVVNDQIGELPFSLLYCPLTGTGMAWDRRIDGGITTFGVSGLLHNNNLMPYDRQTESYWSQMRGDCVNGRLTGMKAQHLSVVETSWDTWQQMFPTPTVLSRQTGSNRAYTDYPYGDFRTNHDLLPYPLSFDDTRLNRKERVHGIIVDGQAKVYRFSDF
ncbi:MAG: DUF3179 domain-containing (seleno)protein [Bacteroidota bacterium]